MKEETATSPHLISVFDRAQSLPAGGERERFLAEACGGDEVLRAEVEELLRADSEAYSFLKTAPAGVADAKMTIGEGGFGIVWVAEQERPLRRKVALKVLKPGMDSRQVLARFEAERQALAIMDHPNIATVHDGGVTAAGRPFFVMELVKGVPITEFCDQHQLPPRARLELFLQVCQAVQHAHQKGIIHRDLKPSNIMVAMHDTTPVVKVIDFGIAKALGQELTDRTLFTGFAQFLGTPLYMSPEQAGQSSIDVDTRSDIYSMGVLLYELLTGTTPIDKARFKKAAQDEVHRIIREEEPPRPSTRLSESKDLLPSISAQRHMEPAKLTRLVRGELDWIVMKALEKNRSRRYETADSLALDVQRYLADEPVMACPPSTAYRLKKFVRRNKGPVLAAMSVLMVLCAGMVGTGWGLVQAERARQREVLRADGERQAKVEAQAAVQAEREAKETALAREEETKAVLDFLENKVIAAARPEGQDGGLGHDIMLRRAIEAALPYVDQSFTNQPLIEARLRLTAGWTFWCLGAAKIAEEQLETARRILTRLRGPDHPDTLLSMNRLATCYTDLGRHAEALKLHEETWAVRKAVLGSDHPETLITMNNVAFGYATAKRFDEAIRLGQAVLELRTKTLGPEHTHTLMSRMVLARSYGMAGRYAEALQLGEETLALQKTTLAPHHPLTLRSMFNLALTYAKLGRQDEALKLREAVLPLMQAKVGTDHGLTLVGMAALADSYAMAGQESEALKLLGEALVIAQAKLGSAHPDTLSYMTRLARMLAACQDSTHRIPGQVVELAKLIAGAKPEDHEVWNALGILLYHASHWNDAVAALHQSMKMRKGGDALDWLFMAMAQGQLGNKAEARRWYDKSVRVLEKMRPTQEGLRRILNEAAGMLGVKDDLPR
jgi:tetratricopeptide (TPR) repeat protein